MADKARDWTDKQLLEMEGHIRQIYKQSQTEMLAKWNAYMKRGQARLDDLYAAYISAPADKKAEALKRYQDAAQNFTLRNKWYRDMVAETTYRISNVNEIALDYINGKIPSIYVVNFNQIDDDLLKVGINWTMRDEHTLSNLIKETLPSKVIDYPKDMAWNKKQINSAVLQGIIQGESIEKIADRIMPIVGNNRASALRNARTMVTGAENRGRFDRYREYEDEGVEMTKIWIATPDAHVRDWHLSMDGQEVPVNDYFIDGHGNELEYPGDEMAEPETVYNCRCSMKSHIKGIKGVPIKDFKTTSLHDVQIAAEKAKRWG